MYKFKNNYVWLLLAILSCQGILQAQNNEDYPRYGITYDIMRFLAQSGTKWRGNREWIKDFKEGVTNSIETNLKEEYLDTLEGRALINKNTKVKAKFVITQKNDGSVIIKSLIDCVGVKEKIIDFQEIEKLRPPEKKDDCSECHHKLTAEFDDATNTLRATLASSCTTTMPFDLFIKEIEKHRNRVN